MAPGLITSWQIDGETMETVIGKQYINLNQRIRIWKTIIPGFKKEVFFALNHNQNHVNNCIHTVSIQSVSLIALCSDANQQAFEVFDLAVILYDNEYFVNHCHINFCFLHLDECFLFETGQGMQMKDQEEKER